MSCAGVCVLSAEQLLPELPTVRLSPAVTPKVAAAVLHCVQTSRLFKSPVLHPWPQTLFCFASLRFFLLRWPTKPALRRYVRSLDSKQLGGDNSTIGACDPYSHVSTAGATNNGIIDPCGLIAHSNFNDTITVLNPGITLDVRA